MIIGVEDPLGDFGLRAETFAEMGRAISDLRRPTLVVQEGGYHVDALGICVSNFLRSLDVVH